MSDTFTKRVPGDGTQSASYVLPGGVSQYIESIVATIDTSGSGDVTPLLTVTDPSGDVIAEKEQGRAIAGGGSGRATWALRLTDESTAASGGGISLQHNGNPV